MIRNAVCTCSNFIDNPNDTDLFELVPLLEALVNVKDVTRALEKV